MLLYSVFSLFSGLPYLLLRLHPRDDMMLSITRNSLPYQIFLPSLRTCLVVSEFALQSCYSIHFQTNALGKGIEPPYSPQVCFK